MEFSVGDKVVHPGHGCGQIIGLERLDLVEGFERYYVIEFPDKGLTVHVPVPEQSPLQPVKVEPLAGVAVRLMEVPFAKLAEHVLPQLMPAGLLLTVPSPGPVLFTTKRASGSATCSVTLWQSC